MYTAVVEVEADVYLEQGGLSRTCFQDLLPLHGWWTGGQDAAESSDVQVVYLPALLPREAQAAGDQPHEDVPVPYSFDAFGR